MKYFLFFFLIIPGLLFQSCAENEPYYSKAGFSGENRITIAGEINNADREMVYLEYLNINKTIGLDSLRTKKDGSFSFRFKSEYPGIYILRNSENKIINLLPHPGEELFIKTSLDNFDTDYTVSGSPESEHLRQLVMKLKDTRKKLNKLDDAYSTLPNVTESQASDYISRRKQIIQDQRDFSIRFVIEHLNSMSSIYALYQQISEGQYILGENREIQYMKIVADSLSNTYPGVPFVQSFVEDARNSEQKFYNLQGMSQKMKEAEVLSGLPDIALPNVSGDTVRFSSLKGKTVLLYFWSTQSETSLDMNPQLHRIYKNNKEKGFEVYAVALETKRDSWYRAISFEKLSWTNVVELGYPESGTAEKYNVQVIPSTFLINKDSEILARDIYGEELQKWLDNIL